MKEKVLGMISGGIDSPLASLKAAREFEVIPIHFCLFPMTSKKSALKAFDSLKDLNKKLQPEKTIIFPWAGILNEIQDKIRNRYRCVACRSCMLLTASEICERENAKGIVTGESLGQKASQTIDNISTTSGMINLPIIRPLIGMNKEEIVKQSKKEGTWKSDHAGCCLATPRKPKTKTRKSDMDEELEKINLQELIKESEDLLLELDDLNQEFDDYLFQLASEFE